MEATEGKKYVFYMKKSSNQSPGSGVLDPVFMQLSSRILWHETVGGWFWEGDVNYKSWGDNDVSIESVPECLSLGLQLV